MSSISEIMALILRLIPLIFLEPLYLFLFIGLGFFVYSQYRRISVLQQKMFRLNRSSPVKETLISIGYGILGGILASLIFVFLGISLSGTAIVFIWITALLLMLINHRFLCFSYASSLVAIVYLLFGFPKISIPSIMALVAILHLIEAVLIFLNGHRNPMPIYIKDKQGQVVGGFSMQRFWPLPFIAVLAVIESSSALEGTVSMPNWWPLLQPELLVPAGFALIYTLSPVFAGLGYSDIVLSSSPEKKTAYSAVYLLIYSIVLLLLALIADRFSILEFLPVIFAPLGHEWVIHTGRARENKSGSVFTCPQGVMVLDVYPNSPAEKMGLQSGDVILRINDVDIDSPKQLLTEMTPWLIDPRLVVRNVVEDKPQREIIFKGRIPPLGFIPVPQPNQPVFMVMRDSMLKRWIKSFWYRREEKKK